MKNPPQATPQSPKKEYAQIRSYIQPADQAAACWPDPEQIRRTLDASIQTLTSISSSFITMFSISFFQLMICIGTTTTVTKAIKPEAHYRHNGTTTSTDGKFLRVFDFNTWGLIWPLARDKDERIRALGEVLRFSNYDIVLLQEVWFRSDYEILRSSMPYFTYFEVFNGGCSGVILPLGCSGLVILSRHRIIEVEFVPYSRRGSPLNFDGEAFVGKGLGRARVLWYGLTIDVFTTHLITYTKTVSNNYFRYTQTYEAVQLISSSNADIRIFGGDINALPYLGKRQPYKLLSNIMQDTMTEVFPGGSFDPFYATYGNSHNSNSGHESPERIDVLMYNHSPHIRMKTIDFAMPLFKTRNRNGRVVSLSDHEALDATFFVESIPSGRSSPIYRGKSIP